MRAIRLERANGDDSPIVVLQARLSVEAGIYRFTYATRTGALLRIDGAIAGAFDREHPAVTAVVALTGDVAVTLEVERRSLPSNHLPPGNGARWRLMQVRATQRPAQTLRAERLGPPGRSVERDRQSIPAQNPSQPIVGHSHLDVAWLWTYSEARRKAVRTFAIAIGHLERTPRVVFTQSQPQLYANVQAADPALFARVVQAAERGAFDTSTAALWVECDTNLPSGESLLRQFAYGMRYVSDTFGRTPTVAWLPDTFGFPSTFPTIAAHAGIELFATTKLMWNDTTPFPYTRFRWRGPDGSELTSALLASYGATASVKRRRIARQRDELLVLGYGDGGGGLTEEMIAETPHDTWLSVEAWMKTLRLGHDALPTYAGELYLEEHRGTLTTSRATKCANASLEAALDEAEELAAWCIAIRAPRSVGESLRTDLRTAWTIVLRNQFHDIAAGTLSAEAYAEVREDYERAERIVARVTESARSILPRGPFAGDAEPVEPQAADGGYRFENGLIRARVRADGTIDELSIAGGPNVVTQANVLAAYEDRPKRWDAWNLDRKYMRRHRRVVARSATVDDGGLVVHLDCGASKVTMRIELRSGEPFLRVDLAVVWNERHVILRTESWLAIAARDVTFGQPHGALQRNAYPTSDTDRAKFEVAGQRYARTEHEGTGIAVFTRDLYGWSARGLKNGGVHLGTSLLRSPMWPDPNCDRGESHIAYAFVPYLGASAGAIEAAWRDYAYPQRVRLMECEDDGVLVVAVKPADDGDGVIVRVRECDGAIHDVTMRCGGRVRQAEPVDAIERPVEGVVAIVEETLRFGLAPYSIRSFRLRF